MLAYEEAILVSTAVPMICRKCKNGMGSFKFFLFRTTGPILTRLGTNHPWGKGIQVCSDEGD
jgi:hypothetical protein